MRISLDRRRQAEGFELLPEDVDELIDRATEHPFGTEFLMNGMLDSVAAAFSVHAFLVEAAREKVRDSQPPPAPN